MTKIPIESSLKRHAARFRWEVLEDVLTRLSLGEKVGSRKKEMDEFFTENDLTSPDLKAYFLMLRQFHEEDGEKGIFCASHDRIRTWVSLHEVFVGARSQSPVVGKCIRYCHDHLFDYGQFSAGKCLSMCSNGKVYWKAAGDWSVAEYIRETGFTTCAYCNAHPVETEGRRHSPLDHYYPRERYPFLALTLSNLIPVCERCNNLKLKTVYNALTHANPMADDLHELVRFDARPWSPRVFSGRPQKGDLGLELNARDATGRGVVALRLVNDLHIESRYQKYHWRAAADLLSLLNGLDSARIETLKRFDVGVVSPENVRAYLGFTPDAGLIKGSCLLKMKIDILAGHTRAMPYVNAAIRESVDLREL